MDVTSGSEWAAVGSSLEIAPGDFFSARVGSADVLAIMAVAGEDRFAVILQASGDEPDFDRFPPPASRSVNVLGWRMNKFTGSATVIPIAEKASDMSPGFPVVRSGVRHGDLVIQDDGAPLLFVEDHPSEHHVWRFFLNLRTGEILDRGLGIAHAAWELVALKDGKPGKVLVRHDT